MKINNRLGVLIVGLNGAVSTTFLGGVFSILKDKKLPIGSLSQLGFINSSINSYIKDALPLTPISNLVFGGWDIINENCYTSALKAKVLDEKDINRVKDELEHLKPMRGVFDNNFLRRLEGNYIKNGLSKFDLANILRKDIQTFKQKNNCSRLVVLWCASTEVFISPSDVHNDLESFTSGMLENDDAISPSMLYAYAAISEGIPFINGTPNLTQDIPALISLAITNKVPLAGKDFKTGQTLIKTVIAPMLKARLLGLTGWFSTNILGNKDGEVLDDPLSFKTKEESKLSVLDGILDSEEQPELYKDYLHKVYINYYPPRGDNKEGWDSLDIVGWMGYPMQIKINFLCRDSILAAPLVLDLILFMDLAARYGEYGIQDWLSFYFKSPMHKKNEKPVHDLFKQYDILQKKLTQFVNTVTIASSKKLKQVV